MKKKNLLATFTTQSQINNCYELLGNQFKITSDKVFVYEIINDDSRVILTYMLPWDGKEKVDFRSILPNTINFHKKDKAFYTINALNKLIDVLSGLSMGNIDYKSYPIDWNGYQNKFILLNDKELTILPINRVFLK